MWFSFRFPSPMFGGLCSSSLDPILGGGSFQRRNCKSLGVCKWITPRWNPNKNSFPIGQSAAEKVALSNPGLTHPFVSRHENGQGYNGHVYNHVPLESPKTTTWQLDRVQNPAQSVHLLQSSLGMLGHPCDGNLLQGTDHWQMLHENLGRAPFLHCPCPGIGEVLSICNCYVYVVTCQLDNLFLHHVSEIVSTIFYI